VGAASYERDGQGALYVSMWNNVCGGAVLMVIYFYGGLWHGVSCVSLRIKPTEKPAGMPWKLPALPHLKKFIPQTQDSS
jgi:hypothetical protein